jgi:acetyl-CoA C-acetyltransferase
MSGMDDLCIAGGVEMMSYTPTVPRADKNRTVDGSNLHLRNLHPQPHQGICADMIATLDGFTREDVDALAVESQRRAKAAIDGGHFDKSLITVTNDDGSVALDHEEFPRPGTTMESLAGLDTVFDKFMDVPIDETGETFDQLVKRKYPDMKINHVHHAGNSSGVVDGAAALIMSSKEYAAKVGWKPRARVRAIATVGGSPTLMLNEPGPAARKVLARAGMTTSDIDLFEVNEAFSVVAAKFIRDLELDPELVNVNGGAMALGHPIGATGSILIGTALDELERRDLNTALITMCTGGGMAPAIIIERV